MKINNALKKILISSLCFFWVFALFTIWKVSAHTVFLGVFFALAVGVYLWYKNATWSDIKYLLYASVAYSVVQYCKICFKDFIVKSIVLKVFFGTINYAGLLDYAMIILLCYILAYCVAGMFTWNNKVKNWLLINVLFSIALSIYSAVLMLLDYQSFKASFFDFCIFDQALYQLSRFRLPASSARQYVNLWYDHQHFSLVLLAPLYWLKPIATYLLITITPFLLITFPSLILYKITKLFNLLFHKQENNNNYFWVIGFSSFLLWLHPYTQSAITFYFHEKYLMPVIFCFLLFAFLKFLHKSSIWNFALIMLGMLGWLGVKEDQWLFVILAWLQLFIITIIFARKFWKKIAAISAICLGICMIYAFIFLPAFQKNNANQQYSNLYAESKQAFDAFVKIGDVSKFITTWDWLDDAHKYLYQNFMLFDLPGMAAFPLNIAANYGERLLSSSPNLRSPIFHYGVDVPIYSAVGILFLILLLNFKYKLDLKKLAVFFIVLYILGFGSILGWNFVYYLNPQPDYYISNYQDSKKIREEYNIIKKLIPQNASLVSTNFLASHFSKREKIYQFPEEIRVAENNPGKNHLEDFEYWILRNDVAVEIAKKNELQKNKYQLLYSGTILSVIKK